MGEERTPNDMEITIVTHHALTMQLPYVMTGLATKTSSFKNAAAHAVEESGLEDVSVSDNVGKVQDDSVSDGADSNDDSSSDTPHDAWSGLKSKNSSPASSGDDTDDNDDDNDDAKHLGKTRQIERAVGLIASAQARILWALGRRVCNWWQVCCGNRFCRW